MLSIIICSRNSTLNESFTDNIHKTVGVEYELICIDNSKNTYSIFSAYNEGEQISKFSYLCFVHEDVFFHTQNWGKNIIEHLKQPNTGIIGLAGGDLAPIVPASWWTLNSTECIIQSDHTGKKKTINNCFPYNQGHTTRSVVLLDGVFLCMKRSLFEKIRFDETLGGFHGYDYDISIQSIIAGYYNYVIFDVSLEHFSKGNMDARYYRNLIRVYKKWEKQLPLFEHKISKEEQVELLQKIEKERLFILTKKLTRAGFSTKEIISIINYYSKLIGSQNNTIMLHLNILFIRVSSYIRKKNNY